MPRKSGRPGIHTPRRFNGVVSNGGFGATPACAGHPRWRPLCHRNRPFRATPRRKGIVEGVETRLSAKCQFHTKLRVLVINQTAWYLEKVGEVDLAAIGLSRRSASIQLHGKRSLGGFTRPIMEARLRCRNRGLPALRRPALWSVPAFWLQLLAPDRDSRS
jgi:hypothetical protein